MIKVGDRVCRKYLERDNTIGTVETIAESTVGTIAIVRFNNSLEKLLLSDLKKVDERVSITRDELNDFKEKILDRDTYDMEDNSYEIIKVSAELIFKRLDSLLFGVDASEG